jgi:pyridoxal phosphate enzyme (YggS family)
MTAATRLKAVQERIKQACAQAQRPENSVQLLAVSKTFSADHVLELYLLEQRAFGENYLQEALNKITQLAENALSPSIEWHFIGPIQSNKTKAITENFAWVHSVDRLKIAQRLAEQRPAHLPPLNVLVQVNTSGEDSKSGVSPEQTLALCIAIAKLPHIQLRGLMTIPSATENNEQLKTEFMTCKNLLERMREIGLAVDTLSMGMSSDLELAIECGATCIRVGTALFGGRTVEQEIK